MAKAFTNATPPLPREFLDWQVALRRHTMEVRHGAPHAGVAPLLTVRRPGTGPDAASHCIVCGLLPRADLLEQRTSEFRHLYESKVEQGARAVYDRGLRYLAEDYYLTADEFDPESLTTLLPDDGPLIDALGADPRCALVFYVFDLDDKSEVGRFRCLQINARAEVLRAGPVYDNVWWHNTLFHGMADEHVVVHFRHESSYDTRFGAMELLVA